MLLVLDGHNVALRAYHALSKQTALLKNKNGEGTWGIYGFFTTLTHFVNRFNPTKIAVTFDWGQSEKRLAIYPEYKAHRKFNNPDEVAKRQESRRQVEVLINLLEAFNIPVIREPNVEADDIIAKIIFENPGPAVVVSGDHDLRQLVTKEISIIKPSIGIKDEDIFNYDKVYSLYGVEPYRLPEVWALTGDSSDNIPGVPGVGEKTAIEMIKKYGSLEDTIMSDESKLVGHRSFVNTALQLIQLDPEACRVEIPDLTFNPIEPGQDGADVALEMLDLLDFNSIKNKWIIGKLWQGSELSVGKPFKTFKEYHGNK